VHRHLTPEWAHARLERELLAAAMPGADIVELPGADHDLFSDAEPQSLGDTAWSELLDGFPALVSRPVDEARGQVVNTTGQADPESGRDRRSPGLLRLAVAWGVVAGALLATRTVVSWRAGGPPDSGVWEILVTSTELWIVLGVLLLVLRQVPVGRVLTAIGPARAVTLMTIAVMLLLGQFLPRSDLHPFTTWSMYTQVVPAVPIYDIELWAADRPRGPLRIDGAFEATSSRSINHRLGELSDPAVRETPRLDLVRETIESVIDRTGSDDVDTATITRCVVTDPQRGALAECETIAIITLDGTP